jgi:hypothetical protein
MTKEAAAKIDPSKVRDALEFYKQAVISGRGGETAALRVKLIEAILNLQK